MFKLIIKIFFSVCLPLIILSCKDSYEAENPNVLAAKYCDCLENQLKNSKDFSVDFRDCEKKIFPSSRLMNIYMSFDNYDTFNKSTMDSAIDFSLKVRNLIDSQCYNKRVLKNKLRPYRGVFK